MSTQEARKRAMRRYNDKFATIKTRIPREEIDKIKSYVSFKGETMNGFIYRLIKEEIRRNP